jgi:hypothetical protein
MKKYLVHTALLIGITFDILFWGKTPGISFFIFVVLCLGSGYFLIKTEKLFPARKSFLLIIPILFLSTMTFILKEPFTSFINYSLTLFLMAIMAMTYLSGLWVSFNLSDYVSNFLHLIGGMFVLPWLPGAIQDAQQKESTVKTWVKNAKPIIRGVLLAVPVLLVFTALFS